MLIWRTFISLLFLITPMTGSVAQERADRRPPLTAGLASKLAAKFEKLEQRLKIRRTTAANLSSRRSEALQAGDFAWIDPAKSVGMKSQSWLQRLGLTNIRWPGSSAPPQPAPTAAESKTSDSSHPMKPLARRNSFVIQLKPDIPDVETEFDALLARHSLEVVSWLDGLGIVTVRLKDAPRDARTVAPATIEQILEPPVVTKLRAETIVEAAVANGVMSTASMPKASSSFAYDERQRKLRWSWDVGATDDGNWGLKAMRLPAAWRILTSERARMKSQPPKIAFLDTGFFKMAALNANFQKSNAVQTRIGRACQADHGTHTAGIVSARFNSGEGIDGMVPGAAVDAYPYTPQLALAQAAATTSAGPVDFAGPATLFGDVLEDVWEMLQQRAAASAGRQVINVSLAYNWKNAGIPRPEENEAVKLMVQEHGRFVKRIADSVKDQFLFVVAAGNDSEAGKPAVNAKWASPFAWAGIYWSYLSYISSRWQSASENIIVVEAMGRDGQRAWFSNEGGHVRAPGVEIMSISAIAPEGLAVCQGTSQAAPHITGLAAILMELDPAKSPSEIAKIIKESAIKPAGGGTPLADAIEAIGKLSGNKLRLLADLNGDGRIDEEDLKIFVHQMEVLRAARSTGAAITEDLNGDGLKGKLECAFPLADLNGSGIAAMGTADKQMVGGKPRTDAEVLDFAWTGDRAMLQSALSKLETSTALKAGEANVTTCK